MTEAAQAEDLSILQGGTQPDATQVAAAEKMVPQSQVNELVGRIKHETYQKAKQDALAEVQQQTQSPPVSQNSSLGGMPQMSAEQIKQMAEEQAERVIRQRENEHVVNQTINQFVGKILDGEKKYPGLEKQVESLELDKMPELIHLTNSVDNTADVLKDFYDNPSKIGLIMNTPPHLRQKEIQKLSNSIKANQAALNTPTAQEPLSQIAPSTTGTDNGSMSISDWRKQDWLRG